LAADGKSASVTYNYKDADDNATAGAMTVVVAGGKDVAGNALSILNQPALTIDLFVPTGVTVNLEAPYDFGTQLKVASASIVNAGSTKGTIYWVAVDAGDPAPVHPYDPDDAVASGSFAASGSTQFISFAPNGSFDLYFYAVTDTGNQSAYTVAPLNITMNP